MYDRALEGYKEGLGVERIKTYIPALNTFENIANLYKKMGRVAAAEEMYSQALDGTGIVLGRSNKRYGRIAAALEVLRRCENEGGSFLVRVK